MNMPVVLQKVDNRQNRQTVKRGKKRQNKGKVRKGRKKSRDFTCNS